MLVRKAAGPIAKLQTVFRARQPSQSILPAAISNIQPGQTAPKPRRHEKTPLCCHSGVSDLFLQLTCVSVKLESVLYAEAHFFVVVVRSCSAVNFLV
jgi:hypothetical protein